MRFEADELTILTGVRHGKTLGSPIAIMIGNTEWPKWDQVMAPDPVDPILLAELARNAPLTRPRPGHADLAGMQKYDFSESRPVLERASARETAARVAIGRVAQNFLAQACGITVLSHVVELGGIAATGDRFPTMADLPAIDADPVRCLDPDASAAMQAEIDACQKAGDTLGGVVEVIAWGCPPGLGSHSQGDRRLDATGRRPDGHPGDRGRRTRRRFRGSPASAGQPGPRRDRPRRRQRHRTTLAAVGRYRGRHVHRRARPGARRDGNPSPPSRARAAHHRRQDRRARGRRSPALGRLRGPAAGVVAEAMVALVLSAECCLEKFGGDSLGETRRNYRGYLRQVAKRGLSIHD